MAPGKGAGYQPLQQDGGAATSIYSVEGGPPRSGRTPAQRKWWFAVCASLVGDLIVCIMIYVTTHDFAPPLVGSGSYTEDTFDLLLLAIARPVVNGVLVALTLTKGMIEPGNEDALPHKMSARARAQEANSFNIRLALQSLVFLTGTACSVFTGIKCILFDFESVKGSENLIAPFLGASIGTINFQFVAIRKLVRSYVEEVGVVLSPLHVHSLKFLPKGPQNRRMRKHCEVCRDNLARCKPAWECYHCRDCNYNLCIACFETKSGELQGDEEENVVRGDKGKKDKLQIDTSSYFGRSLKFADGQWPIIGLALVFLLVASTAGILLPNFQGAILDRVIQNDREGFGEAMGYYIGFQVLQQIFGISRQICFSINARQIRYKSKNILFAAMVRQDIAFFDGSASPPSFHLVQRSAASHAMNAACGSVDGAAHGTAGTGS